MTAGHTWDGPWADENPVDIDFVWAPDESGEYRDDLGDGLRRRDLGLDRASTGAIGAARVRVADAAAAEGDRVLAGDFSLLYVLSGSARCALADGSVALLRGGSCITAGGDGEYRLSELSDDFEVVEIAAPARVPLAPGRSGSVASGPPPQITHDTEDGYRHGDGLRSFFAYRDLGTRACTDDRIHVHVVRSDEAPGAATGWHYHTMAQWCLILSGTADIEVGQQPRRQMRRGDSICLGRGPSMCHNVSNVSAGYAVLEMCVPAEYDTIATDPPA